MTTTKTEAPTTADATRRSAGGDGGGGEISLIEIANALLRHRRVLVLLPAFFFAVFVGRSLLQTRTYSASVSFMPQGATAGQSQAAALAQRFGFNVGGTSAGQSVQFYADLLESREILEQTLESEYTVPVGDSTETRTLIDYFDTERRRALDRLDDVIAVETSQETGMVELTVGAKTPDLAEAIAGRLLQLVNEFNVDRRRSQAAAEAEFTRERVEEVRQDLDRAEADLQRFLQRNARFENSPQLRFEHQRLERRVARHQTLYTSLLESYEQARIAQVRNTPVITVVEQPEGAGRPEPRGTVLRGVLGLVFGLVVGLILAAVRELKRTARIQDRTRFEEFDRLKREAFQDLRRPLRLLPRRTGRGRGASGEAEPAAGAVGSAPEDIG